ncbi:hypothetical protein [Streptomyces sp. PT12]|uniref:hypothetical protein n=1 Tax=Streptomyces sp. PT12 TaxID=1510197 RepID=UPI000DE1AFC3|nr:hypothetical protein [Streptomyces sp. PT12]RBM12689.1 hypothetical protein DEH69_19805 [Streptomyces sp. PT12]
MALTLLVLLAGIYLAVGAAFAAREKGLTYDSGREPSAPPISSPALQWSVADGMETAFRADAAISRGALIGDLTVTVPANCEARTVRWSIAVDGDDVRAGTLTGEREYEIATDHALDGAPESVTLSAEWDGGDAPWCDAFGLTWHHPRTAAEFDLWYAFR